MMGQQVHAGDVVTVWPRAAIHDTVAAIAKQAPYHREIARSLFDRITESIRDFFARMFGSFGGLQHGRAVATIAAVIVLVLVVARVLYAARLRAVPADAEHVRSGRATIANDPWRSAEDLAAEGRFTDAAHALYRATLALLATNGLVRLHASKTSGDYARELRRRGASAHEAFRRFGRRYDRIIYGTGICDSREYATLLDDARAVASARERERAA